jgi:hypothetical protein
MLQPVALASSFNNSLTVHSLAPTNEQNEVASFKLTKPLQDWRISLCPQTSESPNDSAFNQPNSLQLDKEVALGWRKSRWGEEGHEKTNIYNTINGTKATNTMLWGEHTQSRSQS